MNDIDNLDYSIDTTFKDNKLQIEYTGKVFKDNPSLIIKNTTNVKTRETQNGFIVELDVKQGNDLNFSIKNINNEQILNKKENKYETELNKITDLTVIEKMSIWKKIGYYIKKLTRRNLEGIQDMQKQDYRA